MEIADKARCWDALKESCFEKAQPRKIMGIKIPTRDTETAKQLLDLMVYVEMTTGKPLTNGNIQQQVQADSNKISESN